MLSFINCIMVFVIWCRVFAMILPWLLPFSQKFAVFFKTIFAMIFCCPYLHILLFITSRYFHRKYYKLWRVYSRMKVKGRKPIGQFGYFLLLLSLSFLLRLPKIENLFFFSFSCGSPSIPASWAAVIGFEPFGGFVSRSNVVVTCPEVGALKGGDTPTGKVADTEYEARWLLVDAASSP